MTDSIQERIQVEFKNVIITQYEGGLSLKNTVSCEYVDLEASTLQFEALIGNLKRDIRIGFGGTSLGITTKISYSYQLKNFSLTVWEDEMLFKERESRKDVSVFNLNTQHLIDMLIRVNKEDKQHDLSS